MTGFRKPTKDELAAAHGSCTVPDVIGPNLDVLFVGINPGLYSGATGHHFARPGNRYWPALHKSGLTPRLLHPSEEMELLQHGIGLTKLVERATAKETELSPDELLAGGRRIRRMVKRLKPRAVCFLGIGAYCSAMGVKRKDVKIVGRQEIEFEGAQLWVLPNPSGLNANHQLADFVRMFRELKSAVELPEPKGGRLTTEAQRAQRKGNGSFGKGH